MPVIYIKNVEQKTIDALKAQGKLMGLTLSGYVRMILIKLAKKGG